MSVFLSCFFLVSLEVSPQSVRRHSEMACQAIAKRASAEGLDPHLMISIAYAESRFRAHRVSRVGAAGPMQVLPQYWCPRGRVNGCDLVGAGFKAFRAWRARSSGVREALCKYNAGKRCGPLGWAYADSVLAKRRAIRSLLF